MKIISGNKRGKNLISPANLPLRPTSNKVREALFNMFRMEIPGCFFLDLFAGTGAIGINAISEGAKKTTFVEKNPVCLKAIKKNLNHSELPIEKYTLFRESVEHFLVHRSIDYFSFIFLDPPYNYTVDQYLFLIQTIRKKICAETIVVLEHEKKNEIKLIAAALHLSYKEKVYGRSKLSIMQAKKQ
ncbi:MAG: 16S rRNA (guanine(966)-N(2))-methyltransferase RsmD [Caldisericia bacterium]|nr:16S rRNA (guanine(966)-N(2))-methyltransferase RsmD [Caldisericia bacterium]